MSDPALARRLANLELPALVLWGDSDRIADPGYGRAQRIGHVAGTPVPSVQANGAC